MRKRMAAQFILRTCDEFPDTISVCEDELDEFEDGKLYTVIQHGIWWWKSFAIAYFIPDCGAPASQHGGGWWVDVKTGFKTKEQALVVLSEGGFPLK